MRRQLEIAAQARRNYWSIGQAVVV